MNGASQGRTALYHVYDAEGALLYVGISANPDVRWGQHSLTKPWWPEVADRRVQWYATRGEAADAERKAIAAERPRWNTRHAVWRPRDTEAEQLYAQYAEALSEERVLLPQVREQAARDLKAGLSVSELAKMTGLTPEFFRRIARAEGVERKRPPTVGKLRPEAAAPASQQKPHRWEGSPSPRPDHSELPAGLHLSPEVAALPFDRARMLAKEAESRHPDWGREIRRELQHLGEQWRWHAMVEAAMPIGYVDIPSAVEKGRP